MLGNNLGLQFTLNYKNNTSNMGALKQYHHDYLSAEDFDLMFDDEYEAWLENKRVEKEEYEQAIGDGLNQNYCN